MSGKERERDFWTHEIASLILTFIDNKTKFQIYQKRDQRNYKDLWRIVLQLFSGTFSVEYLTLTPNKETSFYLFLNPSITSILIAQRSRNAYKGTTLILLRDCKWIFVCVLFCGNKCFHKKITKVCTNNKIMYIIYACR